jgi:hypothetical protein
VLLYHLAFVVGFLTWFDFGLGLRGCIALASSKVKASKKLVLIFERWMSCDESYLFAVPWF